MAASSPPLYFLRPQLSSNDGRRGAVTPPLYLVGVSAVRERNKGSLLVGQLADLVVIDRDLLAIPGAQLKDALVMMTMVGGKIVFDREPAR